jgi:hypothetical protein
MKISDLTIFDKKFWEELEALKNEVVTGTSTTDASRVSVPNPSPEIVTNDLLNTVVTAS